MMSLFSVINRYISLTFSAKLINLLSKINIDQFSSESKMMSNKLHNEIISTFND